MIRFKIVIETLHDGRYFSFGYKTKEGAVKVIDKALADVSVTPPYWMSLSSIRLPIDNLICLYAQDYYERE